MKNWKKVKLGTLLTESKVISENPNTDNRIRVKLNVLGVEKRPDTKDKKGATKYYIRKTGQFVYGKQNLHKGAFGIIPAELDGYESSLDIPAFDVADSCYPEWIFYFFKKGNFYLKLESLSKGVGSKRIQPKQIFELDIYLPKKNEQRKILDEIEKVENHNQKLLSELVLQTENLRKLRQSILNDAIKGKLTEKWRQQNPNTENATDLLKRIRDHKNKLINESEVKKEKDLIPINDDEITYEIPESWTWERLGNIRDPLKSISYGVLMPGQNIVDGVPLIRVSDLELAGTGKLPEKSISKEVNAKFKKTIIEGGEILITVVGSTIGKTVISDIKWKGANIARAIARFKVHDFLKNRFLYIVIISPYIQSIFSGASRTIGQPTLNIRFIENTIVPIPPIEEQKVIIEQVNNLLLNCKNMEEEINSAKNNSIKLISSVLMELLGDENNIIVNNTSVYKTTYKSERKIKFNSKTINMELEILLENGKLHVEDLWMMSKHYDDKNISNSIDKFYADLKEKIEEDKKIREVVSEKGHLELV